MGNEPLLQDAMRIAEVFCLIDRHQTLIREQLALGRDLVSHRTDDTGHVLAKVRWHMFRLVREYQLFKHLEIFDPVIDTGKPQRVMVAQRLKNSCIEASERYRAFTMEWSAARIEAEWDAYIQSLTKMGDAMERHLQAERDDIVLLLFGTERTRRE